MQGDWATLCHYLEGCLLLTEGHLSCFRRLAIMSKAGLYPQGYVCGVRDKTLLLWDKEIAKTALRPEEAFAGFAMSKTLLAWQQYHVTLSALFFFSCFSMY